MPGLAGFTWPSRIRGPGAKWLAMTLNCGNAQTA